MYFFYLKYTKIILKINSGFFLASVAMRGSILSSHKYIVRLFMVFLL